MFTTLSLVMFTCLPVLWLYKNLNFDKLGNKISFSDVSEFPPSFFSKLKASIMAECKEVEQHVYYRLYNYIRT